ncbi:MAG: SufS family cysteine desulfurase [Bacteroidetes bacterium]|uniref:Cysteine desulfurase n=1 Tax=Candidatus Cryptobacteroides avicola TaxID=2840757 RepID=A0A940DQC5_9BACT|nr:SufS family cysteine desulfurase [Candidatus Cryptobacteroides avicola]
MTAEQLREQFPALARKVYGRDLVYLDNAATAQRPRSVIDEWERLAVQCNANIHRAVHFLADEATQSYEKARDTVRTFINAKENGEVVFTSGATAAVNLVAFSFGEAFIKEGDEVVVTECEHHSNIVPWQMMCLRKGVVLKVLPVDDRGELVMEMLPVLLTDKTKIVAVTHISNVLGILNPVKEIVRICHSREIPVLVDGAQGVVHTDVDVQDTDCDFYVFSGHKIFAATGTGVLYGKRKWLDMMPPYMGGGEMVGTVRFSGTTYAPLPLKFEAGTQNFTGISTLTPALELAARIRSDVQLRENEIAVRDYMLDTLVSDSRVKLFGRPSDSQNKIPLFSFSVKGVHHEDLALILDKMGIAARSGQMCAEPLMDRFGVTGMLRVSFAAYNTLQEAEYFIKCLDRAIGMLQ